MSLGVILDSLAVVFGGITGSLLSKYLSNDLKNNLTNVLGIAAMGIGICSIILLKNLSIVILSLISGVLIGHLLGVTSGVNKFAEILHHYIVKLTSAGKNKKAISDTEYNKQLIIFIVLCCASGTGIYGSLVSGMTGDNSILIAKSILDFFTALIFAANLGITTSFIAIPQFIIFSMLVLMAKFIIPFINEVMLSDFKAVGGFIMLATGITILKIKEINLMDMTMAMLIIFPLSYFYMLI